jgi:hypothetical protein
MTPWWSSGKLPSLPVVSNIPVARAPPPRVHGAMQGACIHTHSTPGKMIAQGAPGLIMWDSYSGWGK